MLGLFKTVGKASLGPKIGEQIAVAVAQTNGCGYCLSAHTAIGTMHGLDAATLAGARVGASTSPKTAAILALSLAIVNARGQISDDALATARRAGVTDTEIVEIVAHVALNVFTNYLNNVAQTTIDFPEVALEAAA
jgi:AhpD family alkylhydroperoxidase